MTDEHLIASIQLAIADASLVTSAGPQQFILDPLLQRAAKNIIAEIGEAAAGLSADTRATFPSVPWRLVIGMRHKVVHDYAEIDLSILWDTLVRELPRLSVALSRP